MSPDDMQVDLDCCIVSLHFVWGTNNKGDVYLYIYYINAHLSGTVLGLAWLIIVTSPVQSIIYYFPGAVYYLL